MARDPGPSDLTELAAEPAEVGGVDLGRLAVLKALGDNTRYAIYLELARSARPLATADVAATLGLHPNTVRPHLERMRDVGLLQVQPATRGGVGRPQHLYSLAADAPSLGLEPASFPVMARMLLRLAAATGAASEDARDVGRDQGRRDGEQLGERGCLSAVLTQLDAMGFDPAVALEEGPTEETAAAVTVAFAHCPFRDLAEQRPDLLCSLHRGLIEGVIDATGGGEVTDFGSLVDRAPCQVQIRVDPPAATAV